MDSLNDALDILFPVGLDAPDMMFGSMDAAIIDGNFIDGFSNGEQSTVFPLCFHCLLCLSMPCILLRSALQVT